MSNNFEKRTMAMDSGSESDSEQLQYKVIVMGDGAVGKTSLINRYCQDGFAQSYKQTIGLDFFSKKIVLPGDVNVTLQIWDIGGQQIGGKMIGKYIHGAHAVCYVYDTTNPESFKNLEDWNQCVLETFKDEPQQPYKSLVGNKIDLPNRQVKQDKHQAFATDAKMVPFLVSAKSGEKVNSMFQRIAADLAGVQLSKAELEVVDSKVTAAIVDHPAAPIPAGQTGPPPLPKDDDNCSMM